MRAVVLTGHGGFDRLDVRDDVEVPHLGPHQVLVRVGAAAVNNTDVNTRLGWYSGGGWTGSFAFPRIQGIDCVGEVVAVGDHVDAKRYGERVLVEPCWTEPATGQAVFLGSEVDGAFAEIVAVPATHAHRVQCELGDVELASFRARTRQPRTCSAVLRACPATSARHRGVRRRWLSSRAIGASSGRASRRDRCGKQAR